jgi:hypothetical protein
MAIMPARRASGSFGQAFWINRSRGSDRGESPKTAPDFAALEFEQSSNVLSLLLLAETGSGPSRGAFTAGAKLRSPPVTRERRTRDRPAFRVFGQFPQRLAPIPPLGPRSLVRNRKTRVREVPSRFLSDPEKSTSNSRTLWLLPVAELTARSLSDPERNHFELDLLT